MPFLLLTALLAADVPAWYSEPAVPDTLEGVGNGPTAEEARDLAKGELCKAIKSNITAASEERTSGTVTEKSEQWRSEFRHLARVTSECILESAGLEEAHKDQAGGAFWIKLRLPLEKYAAQLERRRTRIVLKGFGGSEGAVIEQPLAEFLARKGYVLVEGDEPAHFTLSLELVPTLTEPATETALWSGTATGRIKLVKDSDKSVVASATVGPVKEAAFSKAKLGEKLARKLRETLAAEGLH